jgi:hypothetical protein
MADETHKGIFVTTGQFSRKTKKASKTKGLPPSGPNRQEGSNRKIA